VGSWSSDYGGPSEAMGIEWWKRRGYAGATVEWTKRQGWVASVEKEQEVE